MSFSFNFSPLAAFVLGLLLGFVIEWLLELFYFRRRRRGCEDRLARAEADLQERNRDLLTLRAQADALRNDLNAAQARNATLQADLQNVQQRTAGLQTALGDATTQVSGLRAGRQDMEIRLTSALGELEALRAQVGDAAARRDSLDAALQAREAAYQSLEAALAASRTSEVTLQDELARLRSEVQARDALLGDAASTHDSLRLQLGQVSAQRDSLDAALQARDAAYRALDAARAESSAQAATWESQLAELRAEMAARDASLESALSQSDSLRSQLADNEARRAALQHELATAENRITHLQTSLDAGRGALFGQEMPGFDLPGANLVAGEGAEFGSSTETAGAGEYDADLTGGRGAGFVSGPVEQGAMTGGLPGLETGLAAGGAAFGGAVSQLGDETGPGGERVVSCPQDLSKVHGIGQAYETKLYAAGIGSFWELATADDDTLRRIFGLKDFQKVDLASIKADALRLAEASGTVGRRWDGSQPDDFEFMEGIGAVFEGRLYDAGICTLRALADATVEQLEAICPASAWRRPDYADWIRQAKVKLGEV